jgi:hypothetical protein
MDTDENSQVLIHRAAYVEIGDGISIGGYGF